MNPAGDPIILIPVGVRVGSPAVCYNNILLV